MNNERKFIKYLKTIVLVFMAFMLIVAGFNWFIDPYALFNSARIKGLNDKKPLFEKHMRLSKAAAVRLIKPEVIILGTSRADRGFDKSHPALSSIGRTYNLSFNGAKIYEVYRYLQHANAIQPIKRVVLMLDFIMFNTVKSDDDPAINEKGLAVNVMGEPQIYYEALQSVISSDSIRDSIKTIKKQKKSHEDFLGDFRDPLFLRDDNNRGYRKTFVRNERAYFINKYQKFRLNSKMQNNWVVFERLLSLAHAQQIDLRIAISPSHARQFETLATSGLWGKFETWKRQLVTINSLVSKKQGRSLFLFGTFQGLIFIPMRKFHCLGI